ncbi:hypothetical protein TUMEXPCC7403_07530 [Tumidithrix helvetica PCC 7403]
MLLDKINNIPKKKLAFLIVLSLVGAGSFATFSELDTNFFLKGYGLLLSLQAGFALTYFAYSRSNHHKKPQ